MKNLFLFLMMTIGLIAHAQECPKRITCGQPESFESRDGMTYDQETKIMVMRNVDYSDAKITVCHADKITFDTVAKEMVVENAERLEFFGVISTEAPIGNSDYRLKLRYKLGEGIAYLE